MEAFFARDLGHRRDLAAPRLAVLAMGKDDVPFGHRMPAPATSRARMIRLPARRRNRGISSHRPTCHSQRSRSPAALPQPWRRRSTRPLRCVHAFAPQPRDLALARGGTRPGNAIRPPAATTRCHGTFAALRQRREHAADEPRAPRPARALGDGAVRRHLAAGNPRHDREDPASAASVFMRGPDASATRC